MKQFPGLRIRLHSRDTVTNPLFTDPLRVPKSIEDLNLQVFLINFFDCMIYKAKLITGMVFNIYDSPGAPKCHMHI